MDYNKFIQQNRNINFNNFKSHIKNKRYNFKIIYNNVNILIKYHKYYKIKKQKEII